MSVLCIYLLSLNINKSTRIWETRTEHAHRWTCSRRRVQRTPYGEEQEDTKERRTRCLRWFFKQSMRESHGVMSAQVVESRQLRRANAHTHTRKRSTRVAPCEFVTHAYVTWAWVEPNQPIDLLSKFMAFRNDILLWFFIFSPLPFAFEIWEKRYGWIDIYLKGKESKQRSTVKPCDANNRIEYIYFFDKFPVSACGIQRRMKEIKLKMNFNATYLKNMQNERCRTSCGIWKIVWLIGARDQIHHESNQYLSLRLFFSFVSSP